MIPAQRARYGKIERLVADLIAAENLGDIPPVPVEKMVRSQGILIQKGHLDDDISGLLVRSGDGATIGVNAGHVPTRRRFTIAHEFGHFLLHEGISEHVDHGYRVNFRDQESSLARDVEEIEANFFAASLLMPRTMLDACGAIDALDSDTAVRDLARLFHVSQHAMSLRLANVYRRFTPF